MTWYSSSPAPLITQGASFQRNVAIFIDHRARMMSSLPWQCFSLYWINRPLGCNVTYQWKCSISSLVLCLIYQPPNAAMMLAYLCFSHSSISQNEVTVLFRLHFHIFLTIFIKIFMILLSPESLSGAINIMLFLAWYLARLRRRSFFSSSSKNTPP